jgi:ankyrin repeat protein
VLLCGCSKPAPKPEFTPEEAKKIGDANYYFFCIKWPHPAALGEVKKFLDHGIDVNQHDWNGYSGLEYAVGTKRFPIFKLLLDRGANFREVYRDDAWGPTALHIAAHNNNLPMVKELLTRGLDVNWAPVDGVTPLHYAAAYGGPDLVRFLLVKGARKDLRDSAGRTPLDFLQFTRAHAGPKAQNPHWAANEALLR